MHLIEEELKKYDIEISFTRLLGEALFVTNAFTFYEGCSPYNALYGRQPACLPDFETLDFGDKETNLHEREARRRQVAVGAITHTSAVAKINRALKAKTCTRRRQAVQER